MRKKWAAAAAATGIVALGSAGWAPAGVRPKGVPPLICQTKVSTHPFTCPQVGRAFAHAGIYLAGGFIWQPGGAQVSPGFSEVAAPCPANACELEILIFRSPSGPVAARMESLGYGWRFRGYGIAIDENIAVLVEPFSFDARFKHHPKALSVPNQVYIALSWLRRS